MVNVNVTKLSSKGQIVIPQDMRKDFSVGDKFVIIKKGHQFILKPVNEVGKNFLEDLDFAKKTLEALKRYEKGEFREMEGVEFLAELEKW
ncbi:MAG: AbrB/MazE/SpoVT family DNA-binding domain-containing protein [Candidatus Altiarchaeales archaeon]|nr:AbrB/MazE/SpoVT family DNA-binding domain-containing protein [Candidatus Altiarchaeales archaeon]